MKEADTLKPRSEEAKAFVELAKTVFSVPKKELDRREAEYQRERKRKAKAHSRKT